jgi:transposase-like protein
MPRGYPSLTSEQKQEIINRVKEKGEPVADLAKEYGVVPKTIYNLLSKQVTGPNTLLELAKVKREKEALIQIIGQMVAEQRLGKKT